MWRRAMHRSLTGRAIIEVDGRSTGLSLRLWLVLRWGLEALIGLLRSQLREWAALITSALPVRQSARLRFGWRPSSPGNNNRQAGSPSRAPSNPLTPG